MAIIYTDTNTSGPFTTFGIKDVVTKFVKLTFASFATTNVDQLVARLPADASILRVDTWVRTALTGNSVSAPTVALGTSSGGTEIAAAFSVTNTTGTLQTVSPIVGAQQVYQIPLTGDINIYVRGGCSTGNPTAGEIDLVIYYVR